MKTAEQICFDLAELHQKLLIEGDGKPFHRGLLVSVSPEQYVVLRGAACGKTTSFDLKVVAEDSEMKRIAQWHRL